MNVGDVFKCICTGCGHKYCNGSKDRPCGREQRYAPEGVPGGVTEREAEHIGWIETAKGWACPF